MCTVNSTQCLAIRADFQANLSIAEFKISRLNEYFISLES